MFRLLSTAYSAELSGHEVAHLHSSPGLFSIKKSGVFPLFWKAWMSSFKELTIRKSFKATTISPINLNIILDRSINTTAAQLYKLKIAEEKRAAREAAKAAREKEKAERAEQVAERARQREAENPAKALQLSPNGKRKVSNPLKRDTKRRKQVADAVGSGEASSVESLRPPIITRRGRNVKLPDKYK
ncbi:hypothetical protein GQ43DRAFT_453375 [Delitschia confertaspora ATCC 74209]|uniref:Uncharacterized protein n=1 Tax=Delitschia confertaspora ATCC 74209 TaxID=1513339 RepID=A0A9P4MZ91_9PLEO|nr:hypothetical protein GQ43DRAFT_453375 [Delitschia confertaspora ATCC 74209]